MPISKDPVKRAKQIAQLKPMRKGDKPPAPNGRKKRPSTALLEEIRAEVGTNVTPEHIRELLINLMWLDETKIKEIALKKENSMIMRILSREILSQNGYKVVMEMIQKTVGSKLDITSNGEKIKQDPLVIEVIDKTTQVQNNEEE